MIFSKSTEYALRALIYLAALPDDRPATVREICDSENLPRQFTAKLLQMLARDGYLFAIKGPGGGFQLAREADQITLLDVFRCIDGDVDFERCAVGLAECTDDNPCPLHDQWKRLRELIREYLIHNTLETVREASLKKERGPRRIAPHALGASWAHL